ncbi:MAG: 50S ribosomal protein L10 [Candidatus Harrisonbacteria bacterium]|nr:50S ribosomal protein L10 [Candidatus Harrisonbacteria bacterium]
MLTKKQKQAHIAEAVETMKASNSLLFADFSGVPVKDIRVLRTLLRELNAKMSVYKKRLMKVAFKEAGIEYDPTQFDAQAATIFVMGDVIEVANKLSKFVKELEKQKKELKVLGGYNFAEKQEITAKDFVTLSKLPTRAVLITQIAFSLSYPVRSLMYALNARKESLVK